MSISVFDLFSIGIGPSSSHTVGPMRAAKLFTENIGDHDFKAIKIDLFGSLALTGKGHGTDKAVLLGLAGNRPNEIRTEDIPNILKEIHESRTITINGKNIPFHTEDHLQFHKDKTLPYHPNGMRFTIYNPEEVLSQVFYSVGGGFIVNEHQALNDSSLGEANNGENVPHHFSTAKELLDQCEKNNLSIAELMLKNELIWRSEDEIKKGLLDIWIVMKECIERGQKTDGILPGGLNVKRRAAPLYKYLSEKEKEPEDIMKWLSMWALAVNEENAAGGRVVTAPTNGAAGVIPSVIHYYLNFTKSPTEDGIINFLLTAGAIGILYKIGASISAAEMGCMGEVGVACSMAAGGLTAAVGGTFFQVENAAEIGMEHNLGLTCDPVNGLVQIPCIERNTMGAVKAVNATFLALNGDGTHRVFLDQVIATMRQTGIDMQTIYKETSLGGLAVNVPEC